MRTVQAPVVCNAVRPHHPRTTCVRGFRVAARGYPSRVEPTAKTAPTVRGLIARLGILVVWIALVAVSVVGGDPFRITISVIGLVATAATVVLWLVQRHRIGSAADRSEH